MRLPTHEKPRMISCVADHSEHIGLPRGCLEDICHLLAELKIKFIIQDELQAEVPLAAKFLGELRPEQKTAAAAMLKANLGVLSATTAFGKTVNWLDQLHFVPPNQQMKTFDSNFMICMMNSYTTKSATR